MIRLPGRARVATEPSLDGEAGFTLIELLVAMSIFVVVIAISTAGVVTMAKDTKLAQSASDGAFASRKAFLLLDRQVRYASEVQPISTESGYSYLRFQSVQDTAGASVVNPLCTEWRQHTSGKAELQMRTWAALADKSYPAGGWQTVLIGLAKPDTSVFTVTQPSGAARFAQVQVALSVSRGAGKTQRNSDIATTLVARNSDAGTSAPGSTGTPPPSCPWN